MYLIYDTETTGLPKNFNAPVSDSENWPRCVQVAWQLHDEMGRLIEVKNYIIKPEGYTIPYSATQIHGISTERAIKQGVSLEFALEEFNKAVEQAKFIVGHNIGFDVNIMGAEFYRKQMDTPLMDEATLDTCSEVTAELCRIPGGRGGKFKLPQLGELHTHLFHAGFDEAHNAAADVEATARVFLELIRIHVFKEADLGVESVYFNQFQKENPGPIEAIGLNTQPYSAEEDERFKEEVSTESSTTETFDAAANKKRLANVSFSHLHNHSEMSILQSTIKLGGLIQAAADNKMPGVALTDHGNMMGAYIFVRDALKQNKAAKAKNEELIAEGKAPTEVPVKPILGCEFFVCANHQDKSHKDNGYQVVLLAKNRKGYHNIAKLASLAYTDGMYYVPRIDKALVEQYAEDVICLTGNLYGEISGKILHVGETQAKEALQWWHDLFKDDLYVELMRHGLEEEDHVNRILIQWAREMDLKLIASNNTYYIDQNDSNTHDVLLCIRDGNYQSTPIGKGRDKRYGFPNNEFYFKTQEQMKELFIDLPEAIEHTQEIVDKVEVYDLARDVLLPAFEIPEEFQDERDLEDPSLKIGENNLLRHLTYEGARKRYDEITDEIRERLDFELSVIQNTGYPGYFLIVQDFTTEARRIGVSVGPGRGSAAGSAVAYCIGITNVDPIKYDLLFERFLNPDRVSLPDIDIDFDDEGRQRVIDYVIEKYGQTQVAQIITYGTMAAKSALRDSSRVMELPLGDADRIAKLVPDIKLGKLFSLNEKGLKDKLKGNAEDIGRAEELKRLAETPTLEGKVIQQARKIEGAMRNTGIHACGVIITPDDITKFVPVALAKSKDSSSPDMYCTQFDNSVVENAGLLKMDFLGLKTLTLIKDACSIVKERHGVELDPDSFPLDDEETYALFQRGETVGIFQYESPGMQKYLRELKPTVFADLIAMNALYRPGPLEYIPSFIKRKHGEEPIEYDLDDMEEYLKETYGITVYQEQVMLLSQKLAGFTKGEADMLRKAMGKKIFALLEELKPKFINQAMEKGHAKDRLEKIWKDWEAFASYAFNKSHSTCYAWVAYQTAYLKAHYPAEYMASVLSNNMNDIKQVTFFMEECRRMGIPVMGPDVNESFIKFTVNQEGAIRFGMGALKGVGTGAVQAIIDHRQEGNYMSVFDFAKRVDLKACNKKAFESLALGGGFDSLDETVHRAQYFVEDEKGRSFLETVVRFGNNYQASKNSAQIDMFGESSEVQVAEPMLPAAREWNSLEKLKREKEVVGFYISGHPLDDYKLQMKFFTNSNLTEVMEADETKMGREMKFACIISEALHLTTKTGKPFGMLTVEDYNETHKFMLFSDDYKRLSPFFVKDMFVYVQGKMGRRKWGGDGAEFKIDKMEFLADLFEKQAEKILIEAPLDRVDNKFVDKIVGLTQKYPGKHPLKVNIIDTEEQTKLVMFSRSVMVNVDVPLLKELDDITRIRYQLN